MSKQGINRLNKQMVISILPWLLNFFKIKCYIVVWFGNYSDLIIWSYSLTMGSGYFQQEIYRRVGVELAENQSLSEALSLKFLKN